MPVQRQYQASIKFVNRQYQTNISSLARQYHATFMSHMWYCRDTGVIMACYWTFTDPVCYSFSQTKMYLIMRLCLEYTTSCRGIDM